jgi:hypothetical protein
MELRSENMLYIGKHWYTEPEIQVLVGQLQRERDAYKKELTDWLRKACECIAGDDFDCSICPYYDVVTNNGCPSKVSVYAAKLRLEELAKEK